jgi:hypothetical protein
MSQNRFGLRLGRFAQSYVIGFRGYFICKKQDPRHRPQPEALQQFEFSGGLAKMTVAGFDTIHRISQ